MNRQQRRFAEARQPAAPPQMPPQAVPNGPARMDRKDHIITELKRQFDEMQQNTANRIAILSEQLAQKEAEVMSLHQRLTQVAQQAKPEGEPVN